MGKGLWVIKMIKKYKLFFIWDYEKEEKWINEMSKNGLKLVKVSLGKYWFEKESCDYTYRIEMLENDITSPQSKDYIEFLDDVKIDVAAVYMNYLYLRKKGEFELFSDNISKIKYISKIRNFIARFIVLMSIIFLFVINNNINSSLSSLNLFTIILSAVMLLLAINGLIRIQVTLNDLKKE